MKAVATMPTKSYINPSEVYHHLWDSVHTEKMMKLSEKTLSVCLAIIVIIGATPLFSTVISQLAGRQIIVQFSQAMPNVVWMGPF